MPMREGFHTVTPYLTAKDVNGLVDFTKRAFGAVETFRVEMGPGHFHIEVRIGDSMVMIGGGPDTKPATGMLYLYVEDVDAAFKRAIVSGATSVQQPNDAPDGVRRGGVSDAFGNLWYFGGPKAQKT
jgi:PhnB protein